MIDNITNFKVKSKNKEYNYVLVKDLQKLISQIRDILLQEEEDKKFDDDFIIQMLIN